MTATTSVEHAELVKEARVAQYGCLAPIEGAELVRAQMRHAHRYQNSLIALERARRAQYRELRSKHVDLAEVESRCTAMAAELDQLRHAINAERQAARRRVITTSLTQHATELQAELRAARVELKAARASAREHPALKLALTELDERADILSKALRGATECYWGTYLLVEASVDQARKATVDPHFRRWKGEGRIGVQIQGGINVEKLFEEKDLRLRIKPVPAEAWSSPLRSVRRRATRTVLSIRVGSEARAPVWARFPMVMHRPLPTDARIKGAVVQLRMIGTSERWTVGLMYTRDATPSPKRPGIVALDLGWRKRPDGSLRIAYWADESGKHGEIVMPAAIRERLHHADDLREIQDRRFNRAVSGLRRWLAVYSEPLPAWIESERVRFGSWRSHARFARLIAHWRGARISGDGRIFEMLDRWRRKSRHLSQWESHERHRALAHRREVYRIAAADLARRYGTIILENFDLRTVRRRAKPEDGADSPRPQRAQLHTSAPGELRTAVEQAFTRDGGLIAKVDAFGTTSRCHVCGELCAWDHGAEIWHACEHCGALWDQDLNAAINLLRLFASERSNDSNNPAPAHDAARFRKTQSR